jgi:hypothetical protein
VRLSELVQGEVDAVLTSAGELWPPRVHGIRERALGVADRREVVLGARGPLASLGPGGVVAVGDRRSATLLRAHHPTLRPIQVEDAAEAVPSDEAGARIVPLWPDPTVETRGELLESGSWLPAAGQGIAVLLTPGSAAMDPVPPDPAATALLALERGVAEAFPGVVTLVRGWTFGDWLGLDAVLLGRDGRRAVRGRLRGRREPPEKVAGRMIGLLRGRGADLILESDRSTPLSSFQTSP